MQNNPFAQIEEVKSQTNALNLGSFATAAAFETAVANVMNDINTASVQPVIFTTSAIFAPFTSSGGFSATIQSRVKGNNSGLITVWNQLGFMAYGFSYNGTFTWKKPTLT